jgi:hypothetical protein
MESSRAFATPQARPPCRPFKNQSCYCLGSAFEVALRACCPHVLAAAGAVLTSADCDCGMEAAAADCTASTPSAW